MRRLVLHVTTKVLFGDGLELGRLIQSYFDQRRSLSGDSKRQTLDDRRKLIRTGISIERSLRTQLNRLRLEAGQYPDKASCVLGELANSGDRVSWQPSDSELVAHGNVLFMSGSEPIAVSLAWILLMLSQRPRSLPCSAAGTRSRVRRRRNSARRLRSRTSLAAPDHTGDTSRAASQRHHGQIDDEAGKTPGS